VEEWSEYQVVQKGREPFPDYGKITQAQWEEFVQNNTSEEALTLS
jgi:hypothetical protein